MRDRQILKQIMPYLLVFTCALGYAGVEFTRQISAPASADASNITVNISPVSTEAKEGEEWSWSVSTFVDSYFKDPFQLEYLIDWCNSDISGGADTKTCAEEFMNGRYKQTLTKGVIDVKTRDSVQAIRHESIPCGSAKITVRRGTEVVGYREVDTEIACQTLGIAGFEDPAQEEGLPSDNIVEIINDLFSIGKDASAELEEEESEHAPAIPAPAPPTNPNPGGGTPAPPGSNNPVPLTGNASTDKAIKLYNEIIEKCGSTLKHENDQYLCLNGIDMPEDIRSKLKIDIRSMHENRPDLPQFQCVFAARAFLGVAAGYTFPGIGIGTDLIDIVGRNLGNLQWIPNDGKNRPQPNDLIISTFDSPRGHISFVTAAAGDKFTVIEANKNWNGYLTTSEHAFPGNANVKGWYRLP